jgi:hypothetical protein
MSHCSGARERVWNNGEFIWSPDFEEYSPGVNMDNEFNSFVNFMGPFLLELLLPLCNGEGPMIISVLNFCHFVKSIKNILSQTPFLNLLITEFFKNCQKSSQLPTRYMKRCKWFSIFIFFYVTKISLNILMHDHHLSNITKLKKIKWNHWISLAWVSFFLFSI